MRESLALYGDLTKIVKICEYWNPAGRKVSKRYPGGGQMTEVFDFGFGIAEFGFV